LEDLGQVVLKVDQNLIIWREDSESMLLAAHTLKSSWRTWAPAVAVEHFTGEQRLALFSHINQGIAQLGLAQAMQPPAPAPLPRQIAIVTHAEQLSASDVQILQDLNRHLPGLRWRWVLIGLNPSVGHNSSASPAAPPASSALAEPLALASPPLTTEATSCPASPANPASIQPSKRLAWLSLADWLSLAALLGLGLGAWGASLYFSVPNPAPFQADQRPAAARSAASASAPSPEAAPLHSASAPQPTDSAASNTTPNQTQDPVASIVPAEPAALPPASAAADTHNEVPGIALQGVRWLTLQSPEFFVLEHGAFQTAAQAQSLIRTRNKLANARVIMRKGANPEGRFVVITGPFRSQERAQNYKLRENLPPQIQVRRVSDVLEESVRTAPSGS
jgi:hypothetical protein